MPENQDPTRRDSDLSSIHNSSEERWKFGSIWALSSGTVSRSLRRVRIEEQSMLNRISSTVNCFVLVVLMLAASAARAQVPPTDKNLEQGAGRSNPTVTAKATSERVRFTSPNTVVQLRLEVYDEAGQKLLDTEQRGGNVLDWHLQGGAGERVVDGVYLCVLTSKNLSGRLSQKLGRVTVSAQSTAVRPAAIAELNPRQAQTVGPVEVGAAELTVMEAEDTPAVTVLANNGTEAQLARTRGALTFRVGDFFSGNDKEQMRLTEEGNLGIGTTQPKVKLDVAGLIRAREGFMFSDGSTLKVNEKGVLTRISADGAPPSSVTTTQDKIAKFTDNAGTVGDSVITESAGKIGIGTAAPGSVLDVAGNINTSTQYNIGGNRVLSVGGTRNLFAGVSAGENNTGNYNAFFGDGAGKLNAGQANSFFGVDSGYSSTGGQNSFFGNGSGYRTTGGDNNSFFGTVTGYFNTAGDQNSFFGAYAGYANTGSNNSFFGYGSGVSNSSGHGNVFVGSGVGNNHTSGSNNTFLGALSGDSNTDESNNTFIGSQATGAASITNATALGFKAKVTLSNSLVLGSINGANSSDTNVGIGTTAPLFRFHVKTGADQNLVVRPGADFSGGLSGIGLQSINNGNPLYQPLDLEGSQVTLNVGSGGNVGIGTTTPGSKLVVSSNSATLPPAAGIARFADADGVQTTVFADSFGTNPIFNVRRANGTAAAPSALQANQLIGVIGASGYGTSGYSGTRARVAFWASENWTNAAHGTYLTFNTTANGAATAGGAERLRIDSAGNVGIGTSSPNARLQVNGGNIYIPNPNSLIITSPNGTCWFITVADTGALSTFSVSCP
jgi:hypothetical protein